MFEQAAGELRAKLLWRGPLHPLRATAPVTGHDTRSEGVHCLRIGCSTPSHKNKRGSCETRAWPRHPQVTATPPPDKFRMQFPHDTNRCTLKNRRISTIRFQHLKYTQGDCMRNCWMTEGPGCGAHERRQGMAATPASGGGAWPSFEPTCRAAHHTRPHWCGGCRRGLAAAPAGRGRARSRQISHIISDGHFLRSSKNVAIPTR